MKTLLSIIFLLLFQVSYAQKIWTPINSPTNKIIKSCSFVNNDIGWIITTDSVYKTTDGGLSWMAQNIPPQPNAIIRLFNQVHFINASVGIIACGDYLYSGNNPNERSSILWTDDGGVNWVHKDLGGTSFDNTARLASPTVAYSMQQYGQSKKTVDGGSNWVGQPFYSLYSGAKLFPISEDTVYMVGLDNFALEGAFGKTVDGGANWTVSTISTNTSMQGIDFHNAMKGWISGYGGEIKYTNDGGVTWANGITGVNERFDDLQFVDTLNGWVISAEGNIFQSTNGGLNWNLEYAGTNFLVDISFPVDENVGYVVGDSGTILKYLTPSGIVEIDNPKASNFTIFPNPCNNQLTIQWDDLTVSHANVTIYNALGIEMQNVEIGSNNYQLDLKYLAAGLYYIKIQSGLQQSSQKFIKQAH